MTVRTADYAQKEDICLAFAWCNESGQPFADAFTRCGLTNTAGDLEGDRLELLQKSLNQLATFETDYFDAGHFPLASNTSFRAATELVRTSKG